MTRCQKSDPWVYFQYAIPLLQVGSHFSVFHEYVVKAFDTISVLVLKGCIAADQVR